MVCDRCQIVFLPWRVFPSRGPSRICRSSRARRFVPHAANLLHPLTSLLKKFTGVFTFGPAAQQAFTAAKSALAQATLLVQHVPHTQLALSVDASAVAVGAALEQWVDDSWQLLAIFLRTLRDPEIKYSAFDRELFAIYLAVQHFRHMLEGRSFVIFTDHKPLTFAMMAQTDYSPSQTRHLSFISEFSTDLRHVMAKTMGRPTPSCATPCLLSSRPPPSHGRPSPQPRLLTRMTLARPEQR